MKKENLQKFVQHYFLNNEIEDCIWSIENGVLCVEFRAEKKSVMGIGTLNSSNLDNCKIGINKTSVILSSLSNMDDDMDIQLLKDDKLDRYIYLYFKDKDVKKYCKLSDPELVINKLKKVNIDNDKFDVSINIDENFNRKFSKIENIEDSDNISFKLDQNGTIDVIVNYHKDKISNNGQYKIDADNYKDIWPYYISFNINTFKKIIKANKDYIKAKLLISEQYNLAQFVFEYDDSKFTYYVPAYEKIEF